MAYRKRKADYEKALLAEEKRSIYMKNRERLLVIQDEEARIELEKWTEKCRIEKEQKVENDLIKREKKVKKKAEELRKKEAELAEQKRNNEFWGLLLFKALEKLGPNLIDYMSSPQTAQDNPKEEGPP